MLGRPAVEDTSIGVVALAPSAGPVASRRRQRELDGTRGNARLSAGVAFLANLAGRGPRAIARAMRER